MKTRVISLMLTAAILFGLLTGVLGVRVSAASEMTTSDECIALLKDMEGFSAKPYWDYSQWSVGYGTRCPEADRQRYARDGITEAEAEQLLRAEVSSCEKSLNSFAKKYNLNLTQSKFDALILFAYNVGTEWMLWKSGDFLDAVIKGYTGNDFIAAMALWCMAGDTLQTGLVRRRLQEANLYLNGVYAKNPPSNYTYTLFNAVGGTNNWRLQAFDTNQRAPIKVTATMEGYTFAGWYTAKEGGTRVGKLDASLAGKTLYAHWIEGENQYVEPLPEDPEPEPTEPAQPEPTEPDEPASGESVSVTVRVTADFVNVRKGPGTAYPIVGGVSFGSQLKITEIAQASGLTWGKHAQGWIALKYTNYEEAVNGSGNQNPTAVTGVVINTNNLRIRSGAGTNYSIVGYLAGGDKVTILEQKTVGTMIWGRISKGWISMDYVKLNNGASDSAKPSEVPDENPPVDNGSENGTEPPAETVTGTVTASSLCIRASASTTASVLGYYSYGTKITVLEQKTEGTTLWGKTEKGWVCMNYVKLDESTEEEEPAAGDDEPDIGNETPAETPQPDPEEPSAEENKPVTGKVTASSLCIRAEAGSGKTVVGYLRMGDSVTILEQKTVGTMTWGRISSGWISMDYVRLDSEGAESTPSAGEAQPETPSSGETGTVINTNNLRIRSCAGTGYSIVGYLTGGTKVTILEKKTVGTMIWGRIAQGWISLDYIKLDSTNNTPVKTGTVTTSSLCIREAASTTAPVVGYYSYGTSLSILEVTTTNGTSWGRTKLGWVCMTYVK